MSFVEYPETSDFPIENLPFGVFSTAANVSKLCCLAIHARANHTVYCFIFLMQLMVKEGGVEEESRRHIITVTFSFLRASNWCTLPVRTTCLGS